MALTKINFYLIFTAVLLMSITTLVLFSSQISSAPNVILDNDSLSYITDLNITSEESGILELANATQGADAENPFLNKLSNIPVIGEILGVVSLFIDITSQIWDFVVILYNVPAFIVKTLGGQLGSWQHIINILAYTLLIGIIITFVRLIR